MSNLLRIVPADHAAGNYCPTQGTKVMTPGGEELHGVTGITLRAEVNDIWRAEMSFLVDPPTITGEDDVDYAILSAHEVARLAEIDRERVSIIARQIGNERTLIDFRAAYA